MCKRQTVNPNPRFKENFEHEATVQCKNEYCDNWVRTYRQCVAKGVYCEDCRKEARRLHNHNSYYRNVERTRKRKRASDRKRYNLKTPDHCLWPGCEKPKGYRRAKYCDEHGEQRAAVHWR